MRKSRLLSHYHEAENVANMIFDCSLSNLFHIKKFLENTVNFWYTFLDAKNVPKVFEQKLAYTFVLILPILFELKNEPKK